MPAPTLRTLERRTAQIAMRLSLPDCLVPPANEIAALGLLTRRFMEANEIASVAADSGPEAEGDPVYGALLPFPASRERRMQALLAEYVPCWDEPIPFPATDSTAHRWQQHPESTPKQRERGYRRLICGRCHVQGEEDSSG
jgi:hypothetical protein